MDFGIGLMSYPGCWDDVAFAEQHGFSMAGFVESPTITGDPYMCMALAAQATTTIRIGACLSIPGLRSAPTAAAGLATVNSIAPGRVFFGTGTGLTGRMCFGLRGLAAWKVRDYAREVRDLLAGQEVSHRIGNGDKRIRFNHPKGLCVDPQHHIPVYIAANGPKALQAAAEGADGVIAGITSGNTMGNTPEVFATEIATVRAAAKQAGRNLDDCYTIWPTAICVLEPGESAISPRALRQAGPLAMLPFHTYACYPEIAPLLPPPIRERLEIFDKEVFSRIDLPRERLYQDINAGHLEYLLDGEAAVLTEEIIRMATLTGTPEEIAAQLRRLETAGLGCVQFCIPSSVAREVILDIEDKIMPLMTPVAADPASGT
jgi:5,10-methylenetetrahydromethanopterin reductase